MAKVVKKKSKKGVRKLEGTISVSTTILGSEVSSAEKIKIRPFVGDVPYVGVKIGTTINLGDYSSARIDVLVNSPCYHPEMKQVLDQCYAMADEFLTKKVKEVKGG